jgi:hypothetical protein
MKHHASPPSPTGSNQRLIPAFSQLEIHRHRWSLFAKSGGLDSALKVAGKSAQKCDGQIPSRAKRVSMAIG